MNALIPFLLLFLFSQLGFGQVDFISIQGKVTSNNHDDALSNAEISIFKHNTDSLIATTKTDLKGNYTFFNIENGLYDMVFSGFCYGSTSIIGVRVTGVENCEKNLILFGGTCVVIEIAPPTVPLIDWFNTTSGRTFISKDLEKSPIKN